MKHVEAVTHTPGPWDFELDEDGSTVFVVDPLPGRIVIAEIQNQPEQEANGRLMAAAPDLLESARIDQALQMRGYTIATARSISEEAEMAYLLAGPGGLRKLAQRKRVAAIAKAEGR